jgi:hypothetical protein
MDLDLELEGWKIKAGLAALAVLVVLVPLALIVKTNRDRADDWRRRAVVAEESVTGLRMVIVARSRELNRRTVRANQLAGRAESNGVALRQTKLSVGSLTRRQRELASENARMASENARMASESRKLRSQLVALERVGSTLSGCAKDLGAAAGSAKVKGQRTTAAFAKSRAASCRQASARFDGYLEQFR